VPLYGRFKLVAAGGLDLVLAHRTEPHRAAGGHPAEVSAAFGVENYRWSFPEGHGSAGAKSIGHRSTWRALALVLDVRLGLAVASEPSSETVGCSASSSVDMLVVVLLRGSLG